MTLSLSQAKLLALLCTSFALGFAACPCYDFFRCLRAHRHPKTKIGSLAVRLWRGVEDFCFFFFFGLVFSILFFAENDGIVRPAAFVLFGAGFFCARRLLSRLVLRGWEALGRLVRRVSLFFLRRVILPPLRRLFLLFSALFSRMKAACAARAVRRRLKKRRRQSEKLARALVRAAACGFEEGVGFLR